MTFDHVLKIFEEAKVKPTRLDTIKLGFNTHINIDFDAIESTEVFLIIEKCIKDAGNVYLSSVQDILAEKFMHEPISEVTFNRITYSLDEFDRISEAKCDGRSIRSLLVNQLRTNWSLLDAAGIKFESF